MMILDHPVVPLLGRLMMAYIFATSGIAKIFGWSGKRGVHEHQALADDSVAAGCGAGD